MSHIATGKGFFQERTQSRGVITYPATEDRVTLNDLRTVAAKLSSYLKGNRLLIQDPDMSEDGFGVSQIQSSNVVTTS